MSTSSGQTSTGAGELEAGLRRAAALLKRRDAAAADVLCATLQNRFPGSAQVLVCRARARQLGSDFAGMMAFASQARGLAPQSPPVACLLVEAEIYNGAVARARDRLAALDAAATDDPALLQRLAELYTHVNDHRAADRCHGRALTLRPEDPGALYNLASSKMALGEIDSAHRCLDRLVACRPDDYDAWYNRSTLRRRTPGDNHVAELRTLLATADGAGRGAVALNYALAKELEDLGDYAAAWRALARGAAARRQRLAYDVAGDERTLRRISEVFDADRLAAAGAPAADGGPRPLFVMGLPRSGTTLVDRILSSHSQVDSLGEITDLALAITRLTGTGLSRERRVDRAARLDMAALGQAYRHSSRGYGAQAAWLIDKTPLNVLYLGLIHLALPEALIVHVRRHPLDSCLAMFRTLFRMGYPFSYDLEDLARYYLAYHALMNHWRAVLPPGRLLELDYESLVADQAGQSRRLLEHAGLAWEDTVLEFHRNPAPTATASAVQVREPVHGRSVGRWRCYADGLAPLVERLAAGGVDVAA